jgi:bidirectional [NiFe] hydrogenase diaphorase subunit
MGKLHLIVNERPIAVEPGTMLLAAIRQAGHEVPTLCHHEAVPPAGCCRACTVEISADGKSQLVTACNYAVTSNLKVQTESERVHIVRRTVFELLLAKNPDADIVREVAFKWGITETPYPMATDGDLCIRCGLCVRICKQVGREAIDFVDRGVEMQVGTPFMRLSPDCIGCGSCHAICPTGHITMLDEGLTRTIWKRKFQRIPCRECGAPTVSPEQRDHLMKKAGLLPEYFEICDRCKAKAQGATFAAITVAEPTALARDQRRAEQARIRLEKMMRP